VHSAHYLQAVVDPGLSFQDGLGLGPSALVLCALLHVPLHPGEEPRVLLRPDVRLLLLLLVALWPEVALLTVLNGFILLTNHLGLQHKNICTHTVPKHVYTVFIDYMVE
jgi:hypothetical protein